MDIRRLGISRRVGHLTIILIIMLMVIAVYAGIQSCFSNVKRTSWRLTAPPSGSELHLAVQVGGCDKFERFSDKDSDQVVLVEAYVRKNVRSSCPDLIEFQRRTLRLSIPIGTRALQGCNPPSAIYRWADVSDTDCAAAPTELWGAEP